MISIICPSYNSGEYISELITSVVNQSSCDYELIIVDGGSNDKTLDVIRSYGDRIIYISEKDNGIYDAMNKGIKMAIGEWLYFIGSDDTLYDENVIKNLKRYTKPDVDVILCDVMSSEGSVCHSEFSKKILAKNTIYHQGAIYNRRVFLNHQYDTTYKILADYEFNMYVWSKSPKVIYGDFIFANHSFEGISGRGVYLGYKEEIKIRNQYINSTIVKCILYMYSMLRLVRRKLIWLIK